MVEKITVPATLKIELTAHEVQAIVQALNEMPFKVAQPIIQHILEACREPAAPTPV